MRIQNNIMAINAYRNYNNNTSALSKNLEKLSSGYRINRAGDDAAGLAISEKMRAQITGLDAAQKNVKDGISLVKTAEGAMQEIQDMLNRVKYLATQSSNGTYRDEVDREALQDELNALTEEIDRIADSANFNGTKLLDGSLAATKAGNVSGGVVLTDTTAVAATTTTGNFADAGGAQAAGATLDYSVSWKDADGQDHITTVSFEVNADLDKLVAADGTEHSITKAAATKGELQDAIIAELKKDEAFAAAFKVEEATDGIKFTSAETGTKSAQIISIGAQSSDNNLAGAVNGTTSLTKAPARMSTRSST